MRKYFLKVELESGQIKEYPFEAKTEKKAWRYAENTAKKRKIVSLTYMDDEGVILVLPPWMQEIANDEKLTQKIIDDL